MYQEFYNRSDLLIWPLAGLIIFLAVFLGVLAFTFLGLRDRKTIDAIAALPLEPDNEIDSPAEGRAR